MENRNFKDRLDQTKDDLAYWSGLQRYLTGPSDNWDKKLHRDTNIQVEKLRKKVKFLTRQEV